MISLGLNSTTFAARPIDTTALLVRISIVLATIISLYQLVSLLLFTARYHTLEVQTLLSQ